MVERGFDAVDPDEKLRCYNEAIRLKPDYGDALNNRGFALQDKGDLDGALKDYSEAIRPQPDYADAFYNRGDARSAQRDLDGAMPDFQKYLDLGGGAWERDQAEVEKKIRDLRKGSHPLAFGANPRDKRAGKNRPIR